jgi:phosphoesterase RecJ-like protein
MFRLLAHFQYFLTLRILNRSTSMLDANTKQSVEAFIREASHVAILTHTNPDGDAIGSSLALALALKKQGKDARVVIPDGIIHHLRL